MTRTRPMRRVGLLGGTSWASTADYYRMLNEETHARLGRNHSAEVVVWSFDFQSLLDVLDRPEQIEAAFAEAAAALAEAGCTVLAVASVTGHRFVGRIVDDPRVALVHIADAIGARLRADGVRSPAVLATLQTIGDESLLARLTAGLPPVRAPADLEARLDEVIFGELAHARLGPEAAALLDEIDTRLREAGADALVLACTELSHAHARRPFAGRVYDTVRLHCRAIVEEALRLGAAA